MKMKPFRRVPNLLSFGFTAAHASRVRSLPHRLRARSLQRVPQIHMGGSATHRIPPVKRSPVGCCHVPTASPGAPSGFPATVHGRTTLSLRLKHPAAPVAPPDPFVLRASSGMVPAHEQPTCRRRPGPGQSRPRSGQELRLLHLRTFREPAVLQWRAQRHRLCAEALSGRENRRRLAVPVQTHRPRPVLRRHAQDAARLNAPAAAAERRARSEPCSGTAVTTGP